MKFTIRHTLVGILSLLPVIFLAGTMIDYANMRTMNGLIVSIQDEQLKPLAQLKNISDAFAVAIVDTTHKVGAGTMTPAEGQKEIAKSVQTIRENWALFTAQRMDAQEASLAQSFQKAMDQSWPFLDKLNKTIASADLQQVRQIAAKDLYPAIDPLTAKIDEIVVLQAQHAAANTLAAGKIAGWAEKVQMFNVMVGLLLAAFGLWFVARHVLRPLQNLECTMRVLAAGKDIKELPETQLQNEIGSMARTLDVFVENSLERRRLEQERRTERNKEMARQVRVDELVKVFRGSIGQIRQSLDHQLDTLQSSSDTLGRIAGEAAEGAMIAGDASRDASSNVNQVANAASELTSASREISTQVHKASESVTLAMQVANRADQDISSLATLADRIGAIVDIINSIAEQTNMLALNATIEAARAGDAGRSFAVVASEVKTLAGQTAKATEDISTQVLAIQEATRLAVESIRTISTQVSEVQGRTTAIAAAVEQQEASTHEISRSISLASQGSEQVAGSVTTMVHSVDQTTVEAKQLRTASDMLADVAGNLTKTVDGFLQAVSEDVVERRRAVRHAVRQICVITTKGQRNQTNILDLSAHGVRIEAVAGLRTGDAVEIAWASGERFEGRAVWVRDGHCGIELNVELPADLVAAAA
ncbi:Tar Methyl-accepting chemotaxis protein [Rhabdaerophilaceae bacterium]